MSDMHTGKDRLHDLLQPEDPWAGTGPHRAGLPEDSSRGRLWKGLLGGLLLAGLIVVSTCNYLLFHTLAEVFSIVIAGSLFAILWNARGNLVNCAFVFLGVAYLFIGGLDLIHTLAYKGMGILSDAWGANPATQLWIAARYMESISLCLFPLLFHRNVRAYRVLAVYAGITAAVLLSIFYFRIFPDCYIEGAGLTPFKKISEYVISALLAVSWIALRARRSDLEPRVYQWMVLSIGLTIVAELAFTFYVSVYGLSNLIGHVFKILSFYFVYLALIQTGLKRPYDTLFREVRLHAYITSTIEHPMSFLDRSYRYQVVNKAYEGLYGRSREEIVGRTVADLLGEDVFESEVRPRLDRCLTGRTVHYGLWAEFPKADRRFMRMTYFPYRDEAGEVVGVVSLGRDETERRAAEEALRESEEKFRTLFDASPQAMAVTDLETGRFVAVNDRLCELAHYDREAFEGESTTSMGFYSPTDREHFIAALQKDGVVNGLDMNFLVGDGTTFHAQMYARALPLGGTPHLLTIFVDVTAQKDLEARVRHTEKMEAIGMLIGGIAHDYNNLNHVVLGNVSLARHDLPRGHAAAPLLEEAERAAMRAKWLIRELMNLSSGADELRSGSVKDLLQEVVGGEDEQAARIAFTLPRDLWPALFDARQMRYALAHVIRNGLEAMPGGETLIVSAENARVRETRSVPGFTLKPGDWVKIRVRDHGTGIPRDLLARIFDPYFSTKERSGRRGMGLGLATVYSIVRKHEGYLEVDSSAGEGTTVAIYLKAAGADTSGAS